jgi:hypothetical protein
MKRIVIALAAGLMLTAPGACNCEGEKASTDPKSPEPSAETEKKLEEKTPVADKTADDKSPSPAEVDSAGKPGADDKAAKTDDKDAAEDNDKAAEGTDDKAAEGTDDKAAEGTDDKAAEGTDDKAEGDKKAAEEGGKDPMDEIKAGGIYKGPPSKAIVGTWIVNVSAAGLPDGLPTEMKKELKTLKKITMKFDGKNLTIQHRKGKKNTVGYKVEKDEGISATLTTAAGPEAGSIQVTFLDNDNILINSSSFPVQMRGARKK